MDMLTKKRKKSLLDMEIEEITASLTELDLEFDEEEYKKRLSILERLMKLKGDKPKGVSWDTIVVVAAGIIQTIMIIKHEDVNVITSKAMNYVLKGRV